MRSLDGKLKAAAPRGAVDVSVGGIITICGGLLAASAFIIRKKPNAQELIDKITPYQGWIGFCMFGWGVWETLGVIRAVSWLSTAPLDWIFWLTTGLADLTVGFLLGFGLITKYALSRNEVALRKGQALRARLVAVQVPLGFFAMVMGVLYIALVVV